MSFATSPAPTNVTRGRRAGGLPGPARHVRRSQPRRVLSPGPLTAARAGIAQLRSTPELAAAADEPGERALDLRGLLLRPVKQRRRRSIRRPRLLMPAATICAGRPRRRLLLADKGRRPGRGLPDCPFPCLAGGRAPRDAARMTSSQLSMPLDAAGRRRPCPAFIAAARRATRVGAILPTRRPSRRSSR